MLNKLTQISAWLYRGIVFACFYTSVKSKENTETSNSKAKKTGIELLFSPRSTEKKRTKVFV